MVNDFSEVTLQLVGGQKVEISIQEGSVNFHLSLKFLSQGFLSPALRFLTL